MTYGWFAYPDYWPRSQAFSYARYRDSYDRLAKDPEAVMWSIVTNAPAASKRQVEGNGEGRAVIGTTALYQCKKGRRCISSEIFLIPSARGKGYGTEAIQLRTDYAFSVRDVDLLQTAAPPGNTVVRHVLEKVGYRLIGQSYWTTSEYDMYLLRRGWWEQGLRGAEGGALIETNGTSDLEL